MPRITFALKFDKLDLLWTYLGFRKELSLQPFPLSRGALHKKLYFQGS
jgi:hypothetical protein